MFSCPDLLHYHNSRTVLGGEVGQTAGGFLSKRNLAVRNRRNLISNNNCETQILYLSLKSETDGLFTSSFLPDLVKLRLKFWPKPLMGDLSDGVTRPVETLEDFVLVDSFDSG